jgi:cysteine desulfurase
VNAEPATTYLDHAATTPMLPEAVVVMAEALTRTGNASSLHSAGRRSRRLVEESRERIAAAVGARPSEVVLTTGGTESDNLAGQGPVLGRRAADPRRTRVLVSEIEHHAVLESAEWLAEHEGADGRPAARRPAGPGAAGDPARRARRRPERAALVSVMWANNEVGTVNPVRELPRSPTSTACPLHTDAVQAVGILPVDFAASGGTRSPSPGTSSAGPYGAGALLLRPRGALTALLHGGRPGARRPLGHARHPGDRRARHGRRDLRSPTPRAGPRCSPGCATTSSARCWPPCPTPGSTATRHRHGRRRPVAAAGQRAPVVPRLRGRQPAHAARRARHRVLHRLGLHAGVAQPSHVLLAMGADEATARGSLRFSFGHTSTPTTSTPWPR